MAKPQIDLKFGADLKDFRKGISNIDRSLQKMSTGFGALGGVIGASFAVDAIRQFATESIELANQAEGVRAAFNRINDPTLLDGLRKATKGTINDLELMKMAVKAKNFNIPLEQLGGLLGFAQRRASETGESIDYMAESIVLGIARKSIPILDNLGFSATEVREEFGKTGDMATAVGNIITRQMGDAGEATMTTTEQIAAQRAEITNLKIAVGEQLQPTYKSFLQETSHLLNSLNTILSEHMSKTEKLAVFASFFQGAQGKAFRMYINAQKEGRNTVAQNVLEQERLGEQTSSTTGSIEEQTEAVKKYKEEFTMLGAKYREFNQLMAQMAETAPIAFATVTASAEQLVSVGQQMQTTFLGVANAIGTTLASSFEAALINGDNFFQVFADGLTALVAQIVAAIAAAAILALVLTLATGGLAGLSMQSFSTAFSQIGGGMGVPSFAMPGGLSGGSKSIELFGRLSGQDILISNERAGRNRNRSTGIGG
jgi:hypothetical protein